MKGNKVFVDLGAIFDEIFETARDLGEEFQKSFDSFGKKDPLGPKPQRPTQEGESAFQTGPFNETGSRSKPQSFFSFGQDDNVDYYPNFSYPPMNVYMASDRSLVFEFALAGFDEPDIDLSFQGDYMMFSAKISEQAAPEQNVRYFKRRLKLKDIERQRYYVPLDKFAQERVKAVYRNGILKVIVPPKDDFTSQEGIKIEIIKEAD